MAYPPSLSSRNGLDLLGLRQQRESELAEREANGDTRAGSLLRLLRGEMASDPDTGTAAHARTDKIQSAIDAAQTYQRPDVSDVRHEEQNFALKKLLLPAEAVGQAAYDKEALSQQGDLAKQQLANQGQLDAAHARSGNAGGGKPLASGLMERVAGGSEALAGLQRLIGMKPQVTTGPVAGRVQNAMQTLPLLPGPGENYANFKAESTTLMNNFIKAMTGAQMSEPESVRLKGQVPLETDKPDVWNAKAAVMQKATRGLNIRIGLLNHGVPAEVLDQIPVDQLENHVDDLHAQGWF